MQTEARAAEKGAASAVIEGLRARIAAWRGNEDRGQRMPEELWQEAGAAAQRLGVCPVSRALGLNYRVLKRRAYAGGSSPAQVVSPPRFLELSGFAPLNGVAAGEAIVEVVAADGARLTVRLKESSPALLAVIGVLRGRS